MILMASSECAQCVNTDANPLVKIGPDGLCRQCDWFQANYDPGALEGEFHWFVDRHLRRSSHRKRVLLGISGGKDSTACAVILKRLGLETEGVTFQTGYYPAHFETRAQRYCKQLGIGHRVVDVRRLITVPNRQAYVETARAYSFAESIRCNEAEKSARFRDWYLQGRRAYAVTSEAVIPFVRPCQLCRKTIIRAYVDTAYSLGSDTVVLGMNEWVNLSDPASKPVSGIRRLQPFPDRPPIYIVHLPFLMRLSLSDLHENLSEVGWEPPPDEDLVESNANSCFLARATESIAERLLGFHPDTSRLAREVTAGFLGKTEAKHALSKTHRTHMTIGQILVNSGIIEPAELLNIEDDTGRMFSKSVV